MGFAKEEDYSLVTYLKKSIANKFSLIQDTQLKKDLFQKFLKDKEFAFECMVLEYFELGGQNRTTFDKNYIILEDRKADSDNKNTDINILD